MEIEEDIIIWLFCRECYLKAFTCPMKLLKHEAEHHHKIRTNRKKKQKVLKADNVEKGTVITEKAIPRAPVQKEDAPALFTMSTNSSIPLSQSTTVVTEKSKVEDDSVDSKSIALYQKDNDSTCTEESSTGSRIVYDLVPDSPTSENQVPELGINPCTSNEDVIILEAINDKQHNSSDKKSLFVTIDLTNEKDATVQTNNNKRNSDNTRNPQITNNDDELVKIIDSEPTHSKNHRPKRTKSRSASKSNTIEIDLTLQEENYSDDNKEDSRTKSKRIPSIDEIEVDSLKSNKDHENIGKNKSGNHFTRLVKSHQSSQHSTARKRIRCSNLKINRQCTSPQNTETNHSDDEVSDDNHIDDDGVFGQKVVKRGRPSKRPAICMCHHCGLTYTSAKNLEDHVRQKHNNP